MYTKPNTAQSLVSDHVFLTNVAYMVENAKLTGCYINFDKRISTA